MMAGHALMVHAIDSDSWHGPYVAGGSKCFRMGAQTVGWAGLLSAESECSGYFTRVARTRQTRSETCWEAIDPRFMFAGGGVTDIASEPWVTPFCTLRAVHFNAWTVEDVLDVFLRTVRDSNPVHTDIYIYIYITSTYVCVLRAEH